MSTTASAAALPKPKLIGTWVAQVLVFGIFVMAGPLAKLTAAEPAQAIFDKIGLGAPGMYATGVAELIAMVLIVIPMTAWAGAGLTVLLMLGALAGHLFLGLGVSISEEVHPDAAGPMMFMMALVAMLASLTVLFIRRAQIPMVGAQLAGGGASQQSTSS